MEATWTYQKNPNDAGSTNRINHGCTCANATPLSACIYMYSLCATLSMPSTLLRWGNARAVLEKCRTGSKFFTTEKSQRTTRIQVMLVMEDNESCLHMQWCCCSHVLSLCWWIVEVSSQTMQASPNENTSGNREGIFQEVSLQENFFFVSWDIFGVIRLLLLLT